MSTPFTACVVQPVPQPYDKAGNLNRALAWMDRAAENNASLIVFPEMFLTGYLIRDRLAELTEGRMADVVVEAVGAPVTQRAAIDCVGFTGRAVFIGYAKDDTGFTTRLFVQKELNIYGSRNACPEDFRAVIGYLRRGTCPYDKLITAVVKPEEAADAMRHWHENPGKVFRILVEF